MPEAHSSGKSNVVTDILIKPKSVIRIKTYHFLMTAIRKLALYKLDL